MDALLVAVLQHPLLWHIRCRRGASTPSLTENQIRKIALTRKNSLFAGHEVGAENWALLASRIANCKMCDVDPVRYLTATLRALLDGHPKSRIDELMPWTFSTPSSRAA
ncbi:transposase domain-containing protein [Sulfitobacter sp. 1A12779]|uniref:transposase domain-containing protein n=1 Tax=Sulfitobacter sp. 1A12779 TaxID=3368599 RepID=UPI0037453FED